MFTKNEEAGFRRCLESVKWVDEIGVLGWGSTDATVRICREYTQHVHETGWPGFGPQKNRALTLATGDWVLSLDADEWVTPDLREEVLNVISRPDGAVAVRVPRLSGVCGTVMRHSGGGPAYGTGLF